MSLPSLDYSIDPSAISFGGGDSLFSGSAPSSSSAGLFDWIDKGLSTYAAIDQIKNGTKANAVPAEQNAVVYKTTADAPAGINTQSLVIGGALLLAAVVGAVLLMRK